MFETFSQLPFAYTTFVDISEMNVVARTAVSLQRIPNGITSTPDLETVFIAESGRGGFGIYERTSRNDLEFREFVRINGLVDNLNFNDDGYINKDNWGRSSVIVGVHPNILRLIKYVKNKQNAPTWIVSARPTKSGLGRDPANEGLYRAKNYQESWHIQTELQDNGEWFGGGSGAIVDSNRGAMIGTGLYDTNGAFICRKN